MRHLLTKEAVIKWLQVNVRGSLRTDTREILEGDAFIAWPGTSKDARSHVREAFESGADVCLIEKQGIEDFSFQLEWNDRIACFDGLQGVLGEIADAFYAHPSGEISVIGVTGTNGKTSISCWLAQALTQLDVPCAVIGTLGVGRIEQGFDVLAQNSTGLTTPDPVKLATFFSQFSKQKIKACVMEVSSIGIEEKRVQGTRFKMAIFTNLTQDHLDYHDSMDAYWQAKEKLFSWPELEVAVVNVDDEYGRRLAAELKVKKQLDLWTVSSGSINDQARLSIGCVDYGPQGLRFTVNEDQASVVLQTNILGDYNVANLVGVMAALRALGFSLRMAAQTCEKLLPVPGRMEKLDGSPTVVIDYAHTPDALEKSLKSLKLAAANQGGELGCVFGCGGDRDATKRPKMGSAAGLIAQKLIITSDNPRSEDALEIMMQIKGGIKSQAHVQLEVNRSVAIHAAILQAGENDVILIAGKGHETTQEIAGVKYPFSDLDCAKEALAARLKVNKKNRDYKK